MGYGVNRWQSGSGRAPAAAKRSARGSTRKKKRKKSSGRAARPAAKKSGSRTRKASSRRATKAPRRRVSTSRKKKAPKPKKKRLYNRYDPLTGAKARVSADDPRYTEWLSRKPGKKRIRQERAAEVFGGSRVAGVVAEEAARKAATASGRVLRSSTRGVLSKAGAAAASAAGVSAPVLAAQAAGLAIAGALAYGLTRLILSRDPGANLDKANREYQAAKRALMANLGVTTYGDVPKAARDKLYTAYKEAVVRAQLGPIGTAGRVGGGLL